MEECGNCVESTTTLLVYSCDFLFSKSCEVVGMADEEGVDTDDDLEMPQMEVRLPVDWQGKVSARALSQAEPMAIRKLVVICASTLERKILSAEGADHTVTLPLAMWEELVDQRGSHKEASHELASVINGVEQSWASNYY